MRQNRSELYKLVRGIVVISTLACLLHLNLEALSSAGAEILLANGIAHLGSNLANEHLGIIVAYAVTFGTGVLVYTVMTYPGGFPDAAKFTFFACLGGAVLYFTFTPLSGFAGRDTWQAAVALHMIYSAISLLVMNKETHCSRRGMTRSR